MRLVMPYMTRNLASTNRTGDFFDRMLADFNTPTSSLFNDEDFVADSEIVEGNDHYLVSVDLPGLKKEDIKIEVSNNTLSISGERKRETVSNKNQKIQRTEKYYGSFKRSFTIPSLTQSDKIEANYQDGVLQVYVPKAQAAQARKIEIKSEKSGFFDQLLGSKGSEKETSKATKQEIGAE